jgi:hypothetical protein
VDKYWILVLHVRTRPYPSHNGLPSQFHIDQTGPNTVQVYLGLPLFHYESSYEGMTIVAMASGGP